MTRPHPERHERRPRRAAQHLRLAGAPPDEPGRVEHPDCDYVAAPVEESAAWARWMLERLSGGVGLAGLDELGGGTCGECGRVGRVRYALGRFELCRICASGRLGVAELANTEEQRQP
jgi:hypothetical protein